MHPSNYPSFHSRNKEARMPSFTVLLSYHSTRTSYETQQKATNFEEGYKLCDYK